ncbi:glycosyltransferase family 2 protein [Poseidonibacter lekithochrous]|uniref:glycosyltransferase family 2 protein n=1 Tax=Poseidonibacter lekithochrous TaxID=1904463 RepID=UPI000D334E2E|nr:glycosyltransferase family 2 protein [Poseidonibacter lekithochrous]
MNNIICLNKHYSTTSLVMKEKVKIINDNNSKFNTVLSLSPEKNIQVEGGLRTKGYFKKSYNKKPLISIVTVVFNGEKYLEETILSVINQSYNNIEYIIIDGGSSDKTLNIIKKYEDKIDYWLSESDNGIYDAMNKGITCATGDWIALLNADDYYCSNDTINDVQKKLQYKDTLYYFSMIQKYDKYDEKYSWNSYLWKLYYSAYIPHPTMFVSQKMYKEIGLYDLTFKIAADHDMILRIKKNKKNIKFNDILCTTMRQDGFSSQNMYNTFHDFMNVTIKNGFNKTFALLFFRFKLYKSSLKK